MLKNSLVYSLILCVTVVFSGCASTQVAKDFNGLKISASGKDVAHIQGSISGIYFLGSKPILTGSVEGAPSEESKDTANIETLVWMLTNTAKEEGAGKLVDLQTEAKSTPLLYPIPFLFSIKSVSGSGTAVK